MSINLKVRFKNPVFWVDLIATVMLTIMAHLSGDWSEMTTWGAIFSLLHQAIQNPVVVFAVLAAVWNAVYDPTTAGLSDSAQAMTYQTPKKS